MLQQQGINFSVLDEFAAMQGSVSEGNVFFMQPKQLQNGESIHFRILAPKPSYRGVSIIPTVKHWFKNGDKNVPILSAKTAGISQTCFVDEFVNLLQQKYPELRQTMNNPKNRMHSVEINYQIPVLIIENLQRDATGQLTYTVKNSKVCVLEVPKTVFNQVADILRNPMWGTADGLGLQSTELGYVVRLSKEEVNKKVSYKILPEPVALPLDPSWADQCDDLVEMNKKRLYSDEYTQNLIMATLQGQTVQGEPTYKFPELRNGAPAAAPNLLGGANPVFGAAPVAQTFAAPVVQVPVVVAPIAAAQPAINIQPIVSAPQAVVQPPVATVTEVPAATPVAAPVITPIDTVAPVVTPSAPAATGGVGLDLMATLKEKMADKNG